MKDTLYPELYERFKQSTGVSTDTRTITEGQIFFALKGPNFNANDFAAKALEKGALFAVVDEPHPGFDHEERVLIVEDSLKALQWLATRYREEFDIPVLGITGSNGKTTTKELIYGVLSSEYNAFATPGNLNNHIGVPLSILRMPKETEIAVIEMGANHIEEITRLSEISKPTHGLITNIGKDHLEGYGSLEGSLRANSELYQYLIENKGIAFINTGDPVLRNMSKRFSEPVLYSDKDSFCHVEYAGSNPFIEYRTESDTLVKTNLVGKYNFNNIAAAVCIGKFFSVPESKINSAIAGYQPLNNRSEWKKSEWNSILLDAYNANPSSMEAALESFLAMGGDKKAVILGDMFELGVYSTEEHRNLGKILAGAGLEKIILCGKEMSIAADQIPDVIYFPVKKDLLKYLEDNPLKGYSILIKGSRGMAMEDCLPYL